MEAIEVSNKIWQALKDADGQTMEALIHKDAVFVHMGITLKRDGEIDIVAKKGIVYKDIEFQEHTIDEFEAIVIVLNKVKVTAVVGGNEVVNPFVVTEVYTKEEAGLQLASMSYTRINY